MPIHKPDCLRRLSRQEFGEVSYGVMHHAFRVHAEMGCHFDERIYRNALKMRLGAGAKTEIKIGVSFEDFYHEYFMDLLVDQGAPFELKCVDSLGGIHRSQLMNYLLLCELSHGKLINFGVQSLQHEFVNATQFREDRRRFQIRFQDWLMPEFADWITALLKDIGVGLDLLLYEKAAVHYFGGEPKVLQPVEITGLGFQTLKLVAPGWGLRVTTLPKHSIPVFAENARRFASQTKLSGFHWVNIGKDEVLFRSIKR